MPAFVVLRNNRVKTKRTTTSIMLELFGALLVLLISAIAFYAIKGADGEKVDLVVRILLNTLVAAITGFFIEFAFGFFRQQEKNNKVRLLTALKSPFKSYFYITPIFIVLLFPVYTPIYVIFVATFVGELFGKMIFGGFGSNIFNPALVGRIFASICFQTQLSVATVVVPPVGGLTDLTAGATINGVAQKLGWLQNPDIGLLDLFLGNYRGALGETFAFILIIIGIYLIVRRIICARLALTYIFSFFLITIFIGLAGGKGGDSFEYALRQVMYGGILFGGLLCITDPVTSPVSGSAKVTYALFASVLTALIRYLAAAPEGIAYAILIANMLVPLFNKIYGHKSNHKMWAQYTAIGVMALVSFGTGAGIGAYLNDAAKKAEKSSINIETVASSHIHQLQVGDKTIEVRFQ